jgi:hypothetical protein
VSSPRARVSTTRIGFKGIPAPRSVYAKIVRLADAEIDVPVDTET